MHRLENLIPPPALLLITLVVMFIISRFDRARILRFDVYSLNTLIAAILVVAGIVLSVLALKEFRLAQTTINPLKPETASNFVKSGVFRFTRNPMYLGILLVALSSVAYYGSAWCLIAIAAFIAYITRFQIVPEERAMASLFGKDFDIYKSNTRRWI